jgi:hypothetical protein
VIAGQTYDSRAVAQLEARCHLSGRADGAANGGVERGDLSEELLALALRGGEEQYERIGAVQGGVQGEAGRRGALAALPRCEEQHSLGVGAQGAALPRVRLEAQLLHQQ